MEIPRVPHTAFERRSQQLPGGPLLTNPRVARQWNLWLPPVQGYQAGLFLHPDMVGAGGLGSPEARCERVWASAAHEPARVQ